MTQIFPIFEDPPTPPLVLATTLQLPANDHENITLGLVLSRTPQLTVCDVEYAFGALHTRVDDPVHTAVVSLPPQEILYSRLAGRPRAHVALHE